MNCRTAMCYVGAWEFFEQVKSEVKWDVTTILPPFVRARLSLLSR